MGNQVYKLNGEPLYVFGNVTMPQMLVYCIVYLIVNLVAGGFVSNGIITMGIAAVVVFALHQLGAQVLDSIPVYQLANFFSFVLTKDRYTIRPDAMALPNVVTIENEEVKSRVSLPTQLSQAQ